MRDTVTDTGEIYQKPMIRKKFRTDGKAQERKQQIRKSVKRMTETEEGVSSNVISREEDNCKRSLSSQILFLCTTLVFSRDILNASKVSFFLSIMELINFHHERMALKRHV